MDPVEAYAADVVAGRTIASHLVQLAGARHLRDLETARDAGLVWRVDEAQRAIDYFAEILYLPEHTEAGETVADDAPVDDTLARPFVLAPWQAFIVGSVCGWHTVQGFRRYREAYIETAKGSGKTPLGAGIMLYLLTADGERGAQVYLAAVTRDQAGVAWRDVKAMVKASPELRELFGTEGDLATQLKIAEDQSFLKPVSSEKRGLDGKRVHGALIDELHEHATPVVVNKMRAGTKGRRNALIVKTTNSGYDRTSVCWNHHEHSRQVLGGTVRNDAWFAFVAGLDPCAKHAGDGYWFPADECRDCDRWDVEGPHWVKANPNLGVSLPWQYVRERVAQARSMPSEVSDVLRFNFCVWTQNVNRAIDMGRWAACPPLPSDAELAGADCFGCLDLGETDDFSAFGRIWVLGDGRVAVQMRFWLPEIALERYPNRPYEEWRRVGLLDVTPGEVTDYATIRAYILDRFKADGLASVFYDTKTARETAQLLIAAGVDMVPMTQGFALNEAIKRTLELITDGQLCHGHDRILSWMASNLVLLTGTKGERRIAKERAPEKIDGMAALVMGIEGAIVRRERQPPPEYQLFFLGGTP
jgi:phage terminase large subunit-like protein